MSFGKLSGALEAVHNEIKDLRLHQYSGDKAGSLEGEVYYDPTLHVPKIALNGSHAALLAEPTVAPPTLVVGQAPSIGTSLKGMRSDAKMGLPGVATGASDGFMSSADKAKLDAATDTPTAGALSKYDANGRLIVADAVSGQQAVNFQTLQAQLALNQQGLAEKDPCRGLFTSLPAFAYNSGTKRITASANGALAATSDGVGSWQVNDRIFFCGTIGTGSAQAGPYKIIQVGSGSLPFILERTTDFGGPGAPVGQRLIGAKVQILDGSEHGDSFWVCTNDSITLDTTVLVWRKQTAADVDNSTIELDGAGNLRVKDKGIAYAKVQDAAALSVPGRASNTSGVLADITASVDGQVLRRSGTTLGFGTVANAGLDNMAQSTIKGRAAGAGTGVPTDLSASQVRTILNVADGANAYVHPNHSGDVVSVADGATTIQPGVVTNAKAANMATSTIKGRATAGTGSPEDLTAAQVRTILNVADGANNYSHPNHSGDVVSVADGATTIQAGVVSNSKLANVATATIKGRVTAGTGSPEDLTPAQVWALVSPGSVVDRLNCSLKSALGVGWYKLCSLKVTADTHYSTAVIDVASSGRHTSTNDNEIVRIHARLKQNGAMTNSCSPSVQYTQQGSSNWTVGYVVEQDDASEKRISVYIYTPTSTEFVRYTVVTAGENLSSNAPIFYTDPTVVASQPTPWTDATLANFTAGPAVLSSVNGAPVNFVHRSIPDAGYVRLARFNMTVAGSVTASMALSSLLGGTGASSGACRGTMIANIRLRANTMGSPITQIHCEYITFGTMPVELYYIVVQDDSAAKIIDVYTYCATALYVGTLGLTVLESRGCSFYADDSLVASLPGSVAGTRLGLVAGTVQATGLAGTGTRKALIGPDGTLQVGDSSTDTFVANIGDGAAATVVVAHGLGTKDLQVTLVENATNERVGCRTAVDATNITIYFTSAPAIDAYRVIAKK